MGSYQWSFLSHCTVARQFTKRGVLATVNAMGYDPHGLISPLTHIGNAFQRKLFPQKKTSSDLVDFDRNKAHTLSPSSLMMLLEWHLMTLFCSYRTFRASDLDAYDPNPIAAFNSCSISFGNASEHMHQLITHRKWQFLTLYFCKGDVVLIVNSIAHCNHSETGVINEIVQSRYKHINVSLPPRTKKCIIILRV